MQVHLLYLCMPVQFRHFLCTNAHVQHFLHLHFGGFVPFAMHLQHLLLPFFPARAHHFHACVASQHGDVCTSWSKGLGMGVDALQLSCSSLYSATNLSAVSSVFVYEIVYVCISCCMYYHVLCVHMFYLCKPLLGTEWIVVLQVRERSRVASEGVCVPVCVSHGGFLCWLCWVLYHVLILGLSLYKCFSASTFNYNKHSHLQHSHSQQTGFVPPSPTMLPPTDIEVTRSHNASHLFAL